MNISILQLKKLDSVKMYNLFKITWLLQEGLNSNTVLAGSRH